jgi:hypothetical protein
MTRIGRILTDMIMKSGGSIDVGAIWQVAPTPDLLSPHR